VKLMFSGLKYQVVKLFIKSGLLEEMGRECFFSSKEVALRALRDEYDAGNGLHIPEDSPEAERARRDSIAWDADSRVLR
jgi:hypothetical protein